MDIVLKKWSFPKGFHGLQDDLKIIWKKLTSSRYPAQKICPPKKRRLCPYSWNFDLSLSLQTDTTVSSKNCPLRSTPTVRPPKSARRKTCLENNDFFKKLRIIYVKPAATNLFCILFLAWFFFLFFHNWQILVNK